MEKKPDFEKLAREKYLAGELGNVGIAFQNGCEHVWTALQSQLSEAEKKHKIELSNYAYQIDSAKRERDKAESQNERLLSALKDTTERMKRVRSILTKLSEEPESWQMLNAEKHEQLINEIEKQ